MRYLTRPVPRGSCMLLCTMAAKKTKAAKAHESAAARAKRKAPARKVVAKKARAKAPKRPIARKKFGALKKTASAPKTKASKKPVAAKKKARTGKKPTAATRASGPRTAVSVRRRDGGGHLDWRYAATLREKSREGRVDDSGQAFIGARAKDALAEEMGETWVATATSGEDESQDVYSQNVPEDEGGPFVPTTAGQEFAEGTDASNPKGAKREPFPRT